ncbi:hypothetical protein [Aquimarina rhabdastrellae]
MATNEENSTNKEKFTREVINGLNIDWHSFTKGVANNMRYETMLNNWIQKLYQKKFPKKEALILINKARRFYYIQSSNMSTDV